MRFGFNADYPGHLATQGRIDPLRPDVFRQSIIDVDPAFWVVDDLVNKLGLRPLVCIYTTDPTPSPNRFADIARELVQHQPNVIIQVCNEPNNIGFGEIDPFRVRELINAVVDAVPKGTGVYGPAMSPHDISGVSWESYMRHCYQDTKAKPCIHLYPRREIKSQVKYAFDVAEDCGDGPVQVTEAGCPRDSWPNQADATKKLYTAVKDNGGGTYIAHCAYELKPLSVWDKASRLWFLREDYSRTGLYDAINSLRN